MDLLRKEIRKIICENFFTEEENAILKSGLDKSKTEEMISAFVNNQTDNNMVEIRYEGNFSPLKSADTDIYKGSVDIYYLFKGYQCTLAAKFTMDEKDPSSNMVILDVFFAEPSQKDAGEKVEGFTDFQSLEGNLYGQATRRVTVLIQQKISIDKG